MVAREEISGHVSGDKLEISRTYADLPPGIVTSKIYLTIKRHKTDPDAQAVIQKSVTTSSNGDGQITDPSTSDGSISVFFVLTGTETQLLTPNEIFHYGIKSITSSGDPHTFEQGTIVMERGVTDAAS